jgi:AmmeMemoRadiSam system protein B
MKPKLRLFQPQMVKYQGQPLIWLRDPFSLSERHVVLPPPLAPLLELCDGTRDEGGLRAAMEVRANVRLTPSFLQQLLEQWDEALLLDNERFAQAYAARLQAFRQAPFRPAAMAGESYPAGAEDLAALLQRYVAAASPLNPSPAHGAEQATGDVRGLLSPHIDYQRGGPVYGAVWSQVAGFLQTVERVVILGTDHAGGEGRFTLTRQHYATPWGVLPTDREAVDAIARAVGEEEVFAEELNHSVEHSIELALVWLHYFLGENSPQLIPILCGSFQRFIEDGASPEEDETLAAALDALREAVAPYRTLIVSAADLAHVGPAFGDFYPLDWIGKVKLRSADEQLLETVCRGDAEAFFAEVQKENDRWRICGLPPTYLMLRLLGESSGRVVGYDQCPADSRGTSWVTVCGVVLY